MRREEQSETVICKQTAVGFDGESIAMQTFGRSENPQSPTVIKTNLI
jgi:hypothetical protein